MAEDPEKFYSAVDGNELFQAQYIPKQSAPPASDAPSMKAFISTYPSLGQVTQIDKTTKFFTALLEVDASRALDKWQVSLWHSTGQEWREVPMDLVSDDSGFPTSLGGSTASSNLHKIHFTTPLAIHLPTSFTIKFRNNTDQSWKWVKDHQGSLDGVVLLKTTTDTASISTNLSDYIPDLNESAQTKNHYSQTPGTTLWSVQLPIEAANGDNSNIQDIKFGLPWGAGKFQRWFSLVSMWPPWICPRQGKTHFELDKKALLCSFLNLEGKHLVLLAISGIDDVMTLFTSVDGGVNLHVRNDSEKDQVARVLVSLGDDFESANAAVMYYARDVVSNARLGSGEEQKENKAFATGDETTKLWQENWYDGLSYCTWNALGQRLTEEKVLGAVDALTKNNINVTNFIIDDNWQSIDYYGDGQFQYGWIEFEAERNAFPNGLKHLVTKIREKQPSIQHVAVWHAIMGYWGGISPNGKLAKTYKTVEVMRDYGERRNLPLGGGMTAIAKEDIGKFYDDFYRFLSSCGVDAVKTDAQFMIDTLESAKHRRDLITSYQDAWRISTLRHFSVKAISCMSQTPNIMFHSQLPQNSPPILVRNSDDFFPEIPASHPWHVWMNAHNAIFTQHLNVLPDWDMFQTVHDYSGFHAAARCVSGGPIYITDVPNQHNLDLIREMTGTTPRGKTVIFRPSVVGKSLDVYNDYDDDALLLVGTYHGEAGTGTGIVGFFNISQRPLTELIPLSKFPGVVEAQYYIVRAHSSGKISQPVQVVDPKALITISLEVRGYDILSSYPLRGFVDEKKKETTWIANLGLLGKMAGAAAVVDTRMTKLDNGRIYVDTNLKALGVLGLYISTLPTINFADTLLITILGKVLPVETIAVSKDDEHVLEIDVEKAWKLLDLDSGWSNEVEVKVYINPPH